MWVLFKWIDRYSNHVLTSFLTSLRPPHVDPLVRDLVIGSLVACPDALHTYLPSIRHMCLPRPTTGCLATLQFIRQVRVNTCFHFVWYKLPSVLCRSWFWLIKNEWWVLVCLSVGNKVQSICFSTPFLNPWAHTWRNYSSLCHMASMTPDLWLAFQP